MHKHRFKPSSLCGKKLSLRCNCGEYKERELTRAEQYLHKQWNKDSFEESGKLHAVWHSFVRNILNKKLRGYKLICAVEKWANKFPTVDIVNCDDDWFMSSAIVFIPHENSREYMGTTMVVLPQNGDEPTRMFFYPGHMTDLARVINKINKKKLLSRSIFDKLC